MAMVPKPKLRCVSSRSRISGFSMVSSIQTNSDRLTSGDDRETHDEGRGEPVVLVAFLEHGLQRRQPDRHGDDAGPVAFLQQLELHRLPLQRQIERRHHHDGRHHVDEEDGLPAVILGEIAADGRADRGRKGHGQREHRKPDRLLRLRQLGQHQRERHRDQHAAGKALQAAHRDHRRQIVGEGAGDREHREQRRARQHVAAEREHPAEIVGQRDHHDLADQIRGRDPRAVVDAGADAAFDIEQRGVGDLDVEDRHERTDHGGEHGDPGRDAGAVRIDRGALRCCRRATAARISRLTGLDWTWHDPPETLPRYVWMPAAATARRRLAIWSRWSGSPTCPAAARREASLSRSSAILTGMRCTTLVKLPVALSGGSSANSWPLAGAMLSTWPCTTLAREHVDGDVDRLALAHVGELGFLEVRDHIGAGDRHHRHQLRSGLHVLADAQRAVADHAVDRRDDGGVAEIEFGLVLQWLGARQRRVGLGDLGLEQIDLLQRRGEVGGVALRSRPARRRCAIAPAGRSARCRSRWRPDRCSACSPARRRSRWPCRRRWSPWRRRSPPAERRAGPACWRSRPGRPRHRPWPGRARPGSRGRRSAPAPGRP